jgi:hypothetical protein
MADEKPTQAIPSDSSNTEQLDRIEAKLDNIACAINAFYIEVARWSTNGRPGTDYKALHAPAYPEPNTIPDDTPLWNITGVAA